MLQSRVALRATHIAELQAVLAHEATHFYIDTSFLIAMGALHEAARVELIQWLESQGPRVHVPAWVAHELSTKIVSDTRALTPMANEAGAVLSTLSNLQNEARRFVDDAGVAGFNTRPGAPPPDRVGFLAELDNEARALIRRLQYLKAHSVKSLDAGVLKLTAFVNDRVLNSDIYADIATLQARHSARQMGRQPPGIADKGKDENRYGDLIIWGEVVAHAVDAAIRNVVMLTNDNKSDWVFAPSAIVDERGRRVNNPADRGQRVVKPQPLLLHELKRQNASAGLHIVNIAYLAQLLHARAPLSFRVFFEAYPSPVDQGFIAVEPIGGAAEDATGTVLAREQAEPELMLLDAAALTRELRTPISDTLQTSVERARERIGAFSVADATMIARAVAEVADDTESAAVLVRDLIQGRVGSAEQRGALAEILVTAAYFDLDDVPRNRPLRSLSDAIFSTETDADLRHALELLDDKLGPNRRFILLTPHPQAPRVDIQVQVLPAIGGVRTLVGVFHGEFPLLEDTVRGSPRSLQVLMGTNEGSVGELAHLLAEHFGVPLRTLRMGLPMAERITWDDLRGVVDWGTHRRIPLR